MQEKVYVTPSLPSGLKVRWDGIVDVEKIYKWVKYWLDYKGYGANLEEEEYSEIIKGDRKVIGARWHAEKKVTGYFGYVIEINFFITNMQDITIQKDGREIKTNKGNFDIRLAAYLVKDINEKYQSKFMQNFYERVVIKPRIDEHINILIETIYDLQEEIRKLLAMP